MVSLFMGTNSRLHRPGLGYRCAIAAAMALLASAAFAQAEDGTDVVAPGGGEDGPGLKERIRERDLDRETRVVMLGRARVSYPQELSAGFGAMLVKQPRHYDCTTVCDYQGPYIQLEPGLEGTQFSAGWGILVGEQGRGHFVHSVYSGFAIKAALLRTWGKLRPHFSEENFYGLEASVALARANISVGVFHSFSHLPGDDEWLITGGMGWGF